MKERKSPIAKLRWYDHLSASLDEEQNEELVNVVQTIEQNSTFRAELHRSFWKPMSIVKAMELFCKRCGRQIVQRNSQMTSEKKL